MKSERKFFLILVIILIIPAIIFLLKPEINLQNKFIKFSWQEGFQDLQIAIKKKDTKMLTNKVYGNFNNIFQNAVLNQKVDAIYLNYLINTRYKAKKFLDKCKTFIS
ncbi:MAG: hypothetical protein OEV78_00550 [Spirochaetia bacterium]|nr:hypothetical protein [Spirochaetia bacterium]